MADSGSIGTYSFVQTNAANTPENVQSPEAVQATGDQSAAIWMAQLHSDGFRTVPNRNFAMLSDGQRSGVGSTNDGKGEATATVSCQWGLGPVGGGASVDLKTGKGYVIGGGGLSKFEVGGSCCLNIVVPGKDNTAEDVITGPSGNGSVVYGGGVTGSKSLAGSGGSGGACLGLDIGGGVTYTKPLSDYAK